MRPWVVTSASTKATPPPPPTRAHVLLATALRAPCSRAAEPPPSRQCPQHPPPAARLTPTAPPGPVRPDRKRGGRGRHRGAGACGPTTRGLASTAGPRSIGPPR